MCLSSLPLSFSPLPFFQPFLFFFPSLSLPSDPVTTVQVATRRCRLGVQAHDAERSRYWAQYSLHPPAKVCHPWSRSTILPDVLPGPYAAYIFCRDRYFTYCKCVHSPYCGSGDVFVKPLFKFSHIKKLLVVCTKILKMSCAFKFERTSTVKVSQSAILVHLLYFLGNAFLLLWFGIFAHSDCRVRH